MNYWISSICDPKKDYPQDDSRDRDIFPLSTYLKMAEKVIVKFSIGDFRRVLLSSEDAIADVAHAMIRSDWGYDKTKNASRDTARLDCAKNTIKEFSRKSKQLKNQDRMSFDDPVFVSSHVCNDIIDLDAESDAPMQEHRDKLTDLMEGLSVSEHNFVVMHYLHGMPVRQIATQCEVTTQNVYKSLRHATEHMKNRAESMVFS